MRYLEFGSTTNNFIGNNCTNNILLIHGLGASAGRLSDIPEALSKFYHTIAIDLIVFGKSDTPNNVDYTIRLFRDSVFEFMRTIGIDDGRTCLIGHSLGGYIAAEVAIKNLQIVDIVVLIDSSGLLNGPIALLQRYLYATMHSSFDNVRNVFEQMMANPYAIITSLINLIIF